VRQAPAARSLDVATRRRLGAKVARASAIPAVAAGWLFVKSAAAALAVVVGTGTVLVSTGVVSWSRSSEPAQPQPAPQAAPQPRVAPHTPPVIESPAPSAPEPPAAVVTAAPAVPPPPSAASAAATLSAEAALLERARTEMRRDASMALAIADEHRARYPKGQLTSERLLIQIEALHRLHRDDEARALARRLLGGQSTGLYAERVRALLGESAGP
jgi:type IV secretory pathway VirB10-like protein